MSAELEMVCIRCGFDSTESRVRAHRCYEHDPHVSRLARPSVGWRHLYVPMGVTELNEPTPARSVSIPRGVKA